MPTIIAVVLLTACSDSTTTESTTYTTDPSGANSLFDGRSGNVADSAWRIPESGFSDHSEDRATTWTLDAAVLTSAQPGAVEKGQLANGSQQQRWFGTAAYDRSAISNGSTTSSFSVVTESLSNFLGGIADGNRSLARGVDTAIYDQAVYQTWRPYLPPSSAMGTTWQSSMAQTRIVGKVFSYKSLGTVSYLPRIRTIDASLPVDGDPNLQRRFSAVDANGAATSDANLAAIEYQTGIGYQGEWVDVIRRGRFKVVAQNATSPDGKYSGCMQVRLDFSYSPAAGTTIGDSLLGLDAFQGQFLLFWKPGVGWVYWNGGETIPQWGYTNIATGDTTTFNLGDYNANYDSSVFGSSFATLSPLNSVPYQSAWSAGYNQGYRDVDSNYPYGQRPTLAVALADFYAANSIRDADLLNDNGRVKGMRLFAETAFTAGYSLGIAYYDQDYTAIPSNFDTQNGATIRPYLSLDQNSVPEQFRYDGFKYINGLGKANLWLMTTPTGRTYSNGYNGLGFVTDAFNPQKTIGLDSVEYAKDSAGRPLRSIYVSLPVLGSKTTRNVQGAITQSWIAAPGNG